MHTAYIHKVHPSFWPFLIHAFVVYQKKKLWLKFDHGFRDLISVIKKYASLPLWGHEVFLFVQRDMMFSFVTWA